jgi:hypothetical protein
MNFQTQFDFTLPRGYVDATGKVHRSGRMRLAIALDEIETLQDPRILENEAYLPLVLLSRVILRLGELESVTPQLIANLFASDLAYLEDLYLRLNSQVNVLLSTVCPHCSNQFGLRVTPLGIQ